MTDAERNAILERRLSGEKTTDLEKNASGSLGPQGDATTGHG
jgi:hypothetical protein